LVLESHRYGTAHDPEISAAVAEGWAPLMNPRPRGMEAGRIILSAHLRLSIKMLPNASYFAFTATPKNKTVEIFGEAFAADGQTKHGPFHSYTILRCHKLFRMALEKQKPDPKCMARR